MRTFFAPSTLFSTNLEKCFRCRKEKLQVSDFFHVNLFYFFGPVWTHEARLVLPVRSARGSRCDLSRSLFRRLLSVLVVTLKDDLAVCFDGPVSLRALKQVFLAVIPSRVRTGPRGDHFLLGVTRRRRVVRRL